MHQSAERILVPEIATPSGELLLVQPEVVGSIARSLEDISQHLRDHEYEVEHFGTKDSLIDMRFRSDEWRNPSKHTMSGLKNRVAKVFQEADRQVLARLGKNANELDVYGSLRAWYHDEPSRNAAPHIDEEDENVNSLRAVAAWPSNTMYSKAKRIQGVSYDELFQYHGHDFGTVADKYLDYLDVQGWVQFSPGDIAIFSGVASIHKEPPIDPDAQLPRVLLSMTYRPHGVVDGRELLGNPYQSEEF